MHKLKYNQTFWNRSIYYVKNYLWKKKEQQGAENHRKAYAKNKLNSESGIWQQGE